MFTFKQFTIDDTDCGMKVGTDSVLLGAWTDVSTARQVIDMGAGSGILALMIAQRAPQAVITAVELDPLAYKTSLRNFDASPWGARLTAVHADVFDYQPTERPDLIVCNPPYFATGMTAPDLSRAAARHTQGQFGPLTALSLANDWLSEKGSIALVTPIDYDSDLIFAAEMSRLNVYRRTYVHTVPTKPPSRILWQVSRDRTLPVTTTHLSIRDSHGLTTQYKTLTKDFYLNV